MECDWPTATSCGTRPITEKLDEMPSNGNATPVKRCTCPGSIFFHTRNTHSKKTSIILHSFLKGGKTECYYNSMASCNKFVHCYNNSAHEKLCPDGLVWNDSQGKNECGWPSEVNCGARPITGKSTDL